jgi:PAS domain S-box-containing protein
MKVNTALSFLCLGAGLWLAHNDDRKRTRRILGLFVVIIAGSTLAEYAFHVNLGIDQLLFGDTRTPSLSAYPGRMAVATAICFLLLGLAVAFLGIKKVIVLHRALVGACFVFSLVALCGYLYGVNSLYAISSFSTVAVHTAAGFFAACLAYFLARPDEGIASIAVSDSHSGLLLRTLVPAIVVVPVLIGWLRLAGERANLYDTPFGIALQVLGSIGCLSVLTMLIARSMHRFERERGRIEEALKKSEEKFSKAFRGSPLVVAVTTLRDHRYLDVSESFEQWIGWRREEVIGRTPFDIRIWVDPAERSEFVKRLRAEGVVRNLEFRYRRKDGVEMVGLGSGELIEIGNEQCVISVIADITERKLAEERVRTSEERLRLAQWAAHIGTFDLNLRTGADLWTPETEALYGLPPGGFAGTLTAFENLIHPDDRKRITELTREMIRTGQPIEAEWRVVWPDGSVHWIAGRGQVLMDESGEPSRILGVNIDITERKQAEEALSGMTRKLVEAQEQERVRIARELHDDINQRLALVAIGLDQLREKHKDLPPEVRGHVQELQQMTSDTSTSVYALSHELYSSIPDSLGLAKGMRSWCKTFGNRQELEIDFKSHGVPKASQEISLCLFRVLQEAVHNAAKHSGTERIDVQLAENAGEIHLTVSDSGKGFDIEAASQSRGLGLTSMQERVRLVGGAFAIESKPTCGTTIHVRVPLESEHRSQRAAAL